MLCFEDTSVRNLVHSESGHLLYMSGRCTEQNTYCYMCLYFSLTPIHNQVAGVMEVNVGGSMVALATHSQHQPCIHIWALKEARL